jgi:hypothetical protein
VNDFEINKSLALVIWEYKLQNELSGVRVSLEA